MIARDQITQWSFDAPWPERQQVEQDLLLSRLILEIASDPLLGGELAFRGGTCLHKLHLPTALRYSEDLDYVRGTRGAIGPYIDALREITERIGLIEKSRELTGQMAHFICTAPAEDGGEIRIKIEINVAETESFHPRINTLIVHQPGGYDLLAAADLLTERLGAHLKNAPSHAEINNGAWRE